MKGEKLGYLTGIMYLAPAREAGRGNLCPMASDGCLSSCLFTAGRGRMSNVRTPRINRTLVYFENREGFFIQLIDEIQALIKRAEKQGKKGMRTAQWHIRYNVGKAENKIARREDHI